MWTLALGFAGCAPAAPQGVDREVGRSDIVIAYDPAAHQSLGFGGASGPFPTAGSFPTGPGFSFSMNEYDHGAAFRHTVTWDAVGGTWTRVAIPAAVLTLPLPNCAADGIEFIDISDVQMETSPDSKYPGAPFSIPRWRSGGLLVGCDGNTRMFDSADTAGDSG